jgi:hypothetical protein
VAKFPAINFNDGKTAKKGGTEMTNIKAKALILSGITILALWGSPLGQVGKLAAQQKFNLPTVKKAVICERVEDRAPRGIRQVYPSSIGKLYCFTKLTDIPAGGTIYHIWYHGKREVARVALSISSPQWRTYSSKIILPGWKGSWSVEVVYGEHVLKTIAFAIQ